MLVNKSLGCTDFLLIRIYQFNSATNTGVLLFEGEHAEHGLLKTRTHLSGLPPVTTTLKNGRYFHVLPKDANAIKSHAGDRLVPVCWFEDNRFQKSRFYIRVVDE